MPALGVVPPAPRDLEHVITRSAEKRARARRTHTMNIKVVVLHYQPLRPIASQSHLSRGAAETNRGVHEAKLGRR